MFIYLIKFNLLSDNYTDMYNKASKYMDNKWDYGRIRLHITISNQIIWYIFDNDRVLIHNDDIDENDKLKPAIIDYVYSKCYLNNKYISDYKYKCGCYSYCDNNCKCTHHT